MFGWQVFFFLLGLISLVGQATLLREMATLFYGNEIVYSLGLGIWLAFTGLGSLLSKKINFLKRRWHSWTILFALVLLLPVFILLLRFLTPKLILRGEALPPFLIASIFLLTFSSFCLSLGLSFPLAIKTFKSKTQVPINWGYFWETLGLIVGGLIFSFLLGQTSFPLPEKINFASTKWQFPQLSGVVNSKYQRITVTETNGQLNYFLNGQLSFTTNEDLENKNFLNLVKPYTDNPQKILLLTNPTLANFFQKQFPDAEIKLLETDEKYLQTWRPLLDHKIEILVLDLRKFLKSHSGKYDLIVCSPGNPQTLLTNRLFTKESFDLFKRNLDGRGIFVLSFSLPIDYQGKEVIAFGASIYQTFKKVFPVNELLVKEGQILLLGGSNLSANANLKNEFFLSQFQSTQRKKIIEDWSSKKEAINTDLIPVAFFYYQLFWQKILNFKFPYLLSITAKFAPFLLLITLFLLLNKKRSLQLGAIMSMSSFVLISLETLIIFMFQTKIGYLFGQISLIFSLFLAGMAAGVGLARIPFVTLKRSLLVLLISLLLFSWLLKSTITEEELFWLVFAFIFGIFGGANFSLLNNLFNNLYLDKDKNPGLIYAFDLFGSSLGALLAGTIFLPFYGTRQFLLGLIGIIFVGVIAKLPK